VADVYRIGVAISLTNNVSAALRVIQRDVLGLGRSVDLTQGKFDRLKLAIGGAAAAFVGVGMLKGFDALANAGGELLNQQQKILAAGTTQSDLAKEMATAYQMAAISGSTLAQNLKMVADLRSVLGYSNLGEAQALAPTMLRAGIAAGNLTGMDPEQAAYNIALIEDRLGYTLNQKTGKLDADRAGQMANLIDAIISGTNGRVDTQQLLMFAQRALASGKLLSTQGLINLVPIIQAMTGTIAGTALTAFDKALVGGVMTTRGTSWLQGLGLYNGPTKKEGSGYVRMNPNDIAGSGIVGLDPQAWVNQYLLPALRSAVGPKGTLQDMLKLLAQSGFANTTVRFLSELVGSSVQNAKDVQNINVAAGADQYGKMMQSLAGAEGNFTSALNSLWQALGLPAATMGVKILNTLSGGIRNFTQWVGAHPAYADAMVKALLGLGAALTVLGGAAVVAAIATMIGSGGTIALVGAALVGISAVFLSLRDPVADAKAVFKAVGGWVVDLTKDVTGLAHPFQTLSNDFKIAAGWVDGLAASLGALANPIQALEKLLGFFGPSSAASIHGAYGRHVPTALPAPSPAAAVPPPASTIHGAYGRHVPQQLGEADIPADNAVIANWIRSGAPMTVTNTGDIARGANAFVGRQLGRPNTGATGVNLRATPAGSAALAIPAYG
jgi:hypothetical protein